jgi:ribosomal protein S15P/S13E
VAPGEGRASVVPDGNRDGHPDLDARIAALNRRIEQLEEHIDTHRHELDPKEFAALASLQGQLASRLGRLMRDRQQLQGDAADELQHDLDEALATVSQVLGIDLTVQA